MGFLSGLAMVAALGVNQVQCAQQDLPPALRDLFTQGVEAEKAGQLEAAERAFQRVLSQGGRVAFVYNNLGIVYQMRRDHQQAIAYFREAVRLQPSYPAPHLLMGASLLALGKVPEATRELERSVKLQPREALARQQLAKAYEVASNRMGLVDQLRALRELAPQEPEYPFQLGNAYLKLALWSYQEISRLNPRSARAYQALAETYRAQGRLEFAAGAFQRAAQADPKLPEIHLALAQVFLALGKRAEARKEIDQELVIVPEGAAALALKEQINAATQEP